MGRTGKVELECRNTRRKKRSEGWGSDESDEDFTIGEDEDYGSDEYCSSLEPDDSVEGFGEFDVEEEEEVKMKMNRAAKLNMQKGALFKRRKGLKKLHKKRRLTYKQEDDDNDDSDDDNDAEFLPDEIYVVDDEDEKPEPVVKKENSCFKEEDDNDYDVGNDDEDGGDDDTDDGCDGSDDCGSDDCGGDDDGGHDDDGSDDGGDDDEEDEEFTLDGIDFVEEEDDIPTPKKNKRVRKSRSPGAGLTKRRKRKIKSEVFKKSTPILKKPRTNRRLVKRNSNGIPAIWSVGKTSSGSDGELANKSLLVEERKKKIPGRRRRRFIANSDSDFVKSEPSDFEFTISEEEREQVREANTFCTSVSTSLRSSLLSKKFKDEDETLKQRKNPVRKGKEKVQDSNKEEVKQICGICLSEEGKRTIQGILSCCSHYFCFACIMEWSKVESRCPLCKQRFGTISKRVRSDSGVDLRSAPIQVPERDQVYQPSEEELREFLDPYDDVICTECQQGGDDALMLLCDTCDSPAHTYCVGLEREVPEGNWFCNVCRPAACSAIESHSIDFTPDQRAINSLAGLTSPARSVGVLDLNSLYVPDTPLSQEAAGYPFSRRCIRDFSVPSPTSGSGVSTLSGRRMVQRHIQHIIHNRWNPSGSQSNGIPSTSSGIRLFGSQIDRGTELTFQQTMPLERRASQYTSNQGRLQDFSPNSFPSRDVYSARSSQWIEQGQNPFSTSRLSYEQIHPCISRSNVDSDSQSHTFREVRHLTIENEQVQQMVRSHLESLSSNTELGMDR